MCSRSFLLQWKRSCGFQIRWFDLSFFLVRIQMWRGTICVILKYYLLSMFIFIMVKLSWSIISELWRLTLISFLLPSSLSFPAVIDANPSGILALGASGDSAHSTTREGIDGVAVRIFGGEIHNIRIGRLGGHRRGWEAAKLSSGMISTWGTYFSVT